jgi:hypothetical protein
MPQAPRTSSRLGSIAALVVCLCACTGSDSNESLSYERAVAISRDAATKHGYDLSKYTLDTFGDPKGAGDSTWLIGYKCQPDPPPPGCGFLVAVDRKSGEAKVMPGA